MPQLPQEVRDGPGEVFIGVETCHLSGRLVRGDLLLDLVAVGADVGPRVGKVLGPERGIGAKERFLTGP